MNEQLPTKLNMCTLMTSSIAPQYFGFTEDETQFLCKLHDMSIEDCKRWYNGYTISYNRELYEIYHPDSVIQSIAKKHYENYWIKINVYDAIKYYISLGIKNLKDEVNALIAGEHIDVDVCYNVGPVLAIHSKCDIFTYLIHLGYLAYDSDKKQCYIPNNEIRSEWINAIEDDKSYAEAIRIVNNSKRLLDKTVEGDAQAVAEALSAAHEQLMSKQRYNHEACLQSAIRFAYFYATSRYTIISELPAGKGYADVVFIPYIPNVPAMIVELKRNQSTGAALQQIESRQYFNVMDKYQGDLLLVAVNYDEKTNVHTCEIKQYIK